MERDTVSSVMSPGSPYTTVTVESRCAVGKGRGWSMPASSLMMKIVAHQSRFGVQSTMGGGVSWSWWMEPWTGIGTSRSWGIECCHGQRGCLDVTLCTSKTMPRPIQHVIRQPFWTNRMLRSWLASSKSRHEPNWACLGWNVSLDPRHEWPHFHRSWTKQYCRAGVSCSSARKGADPGREHASSCQGSSSR